MSEQQPNDMDIRRTLIQLHEELERTQTLDENEQALMSHLMEDIQAVLKRSEKKGGAVILPENSNLIDQLEDSVGVFEVSHPTLTSVILKALDVLNIAGI
jgi:hypothetical protein